MIISSQLVFEALLVGIMTLLVGVATGAMFSLLPRPLDPIHRNRYHIMELTLFTTGFIVHLGCQFTGLNKFYCKHGKACRM